MLQQEIDVIVFDIRNQKNEWKRHHRNNFQM